ncbi:MAG: hypothetical protein HC886_15925 [Leptolyngbyaceae cyanobacterium SM1_1_3]|nr:hypothetical protein [Leptolyngbyaceae cyanobacterium SM1_1_3]NJM85024.1 hypothetical protein [Leptolyngbyaceae cyanobacterium RM2_2_21]NJN04180.1 hypothetical protein [Leptolyngbyaceae cyanobacterium RM1_1_2]NJO08612.1 hypothetical protein [Leptolyngbyaceae cyanobacterium SL_1_1]
MQQSFLGLAAIAASLLFTPMSWAQIKDTMRVEEDNRFQQEDFSQSLFYQIPHGADACNFYGMAAACSFERQHVFRDAVLITSKETTYYVRSTLIPNQSVSPEQGIAYAQILAGMSGNSGIEFVNPTVSNERISYVGCPSFDSHLCGADLALTPDGLVREIAVTYSTP